MPLSRWPGAAAAILLAGLPAPAARAAMLAPHHAVYLLALDTTKEEGVMAATGTMTFDVQDACTAWATSQHMEIQLTRKDGQDVKMVSDYATLESKDGRHLDFHTRETTDGAVTQRIDGSAALDASGKGEAHFTDPQPSTAALPAGTRLPMAHTAAIIDAALAGKRFLSMPLFDGTGTGGAEDSFVVIESWKPAAPQKWPVLSRLSFGHVHVAFFDRTAAAETPTYEIGMQYWVDGIADHLAMNFGEFSLNGALNQLELRPPGHCGQARP